MKKTIIALAVLGASAGFAHAQSHVTIYGTADAGFVKESGTSATMGSYETSRLGFRGSEDLGSGLRATFQLEHRLNLNDGTQINSSTKPWGSPDRNFYDWRHGNTNAFWQGGANVGLAGEFGTVRLGRVNELSTESYRKIDPFNNSGVGTGFLSALRSETISNTIRYDSPSMAGFNVGLSYSLKADDHNTALPSDLFNAGYAISLKYDQGPFLGVANWNRASDSNKSTNWNLGGAYTFQDFTFSLGYQRTKAKINWLDQQLLIAPANGIRQKDWLAGINWKLGPGALKLSYNHSRVDSVDLPGKEKVKRYAIGYIYDVSKRTSVYGVYAHTKSDSPELGALYNTNGGIDSSANAYQIGLNHKF